MANQQPGEQTRSLDTSSETCVTSKGPVSNTLCLAFAPCAKQTPPTTDSIQNLSSLLILFLICPIVLAPPPLSRKACDIALDLQRHAPSLKLLSSRCRLVTWPPGHLRIARGDVGGMTFSTPPTSKARCSLRLCCDSSLPASLISLLLIVLCFGQVARISSLAPPNTLTRGFERHPH